MGAVGTGVEVCTVTGSGALSGYFCDVMQQEPGSQADCDGDGKEMIK